MCKGKVIYKVKTAQNEYVKSIYIYIYIYKLILIYSQKIIYIFNVVNKIYE